jgi:hypothetical protein
MIARAAHGVWDFVVGDDWQVALVVVVALGTTTVLAAAGVAAWWLAPLAALAALYRSVRRAAKP